MAGWWPLRGSVGNQTIPLPPENLRPGDCDLEIDPSHPKGTVTAKPRRGLKRGPLPITPVAFLYLTIFRTEVETCRDCFNWLFDQWWTWCTWWVDAQLHVSGLHHCQKRTGWASPDNPDEGQCYQEVETHWMHYSFLSYCESRHTNPLHRARFFSLGQVAHLQS